MLGTQLKLTGVKGVGTISLEVEPNKRIYTLIGMNGAGKTKTLEALFQSLLATHKQFYQVCGGNSVSWILSELISNDHQFFQTHNNNISIKKIRSKNPNLASHELPTVFLASQNRGFIRHHSKPVKNIGSFTERRAEYFSSLLKGMNNNFSSLNMDTGTEEWFTTMAQSSNPYQASEDNRQVELTTMLQLLNAIDDRIDSEFLKISGDGRVSIKIDDEERELSHLSTGFASILKIIQAIISGYSYFTNEIQLQNVRGIVLIDEIESHLHLSWQAHIIPLLKRLFPNTTFYITTHSSIVLSQLEEGEVYRLERDNDGIVRTHLIQSPDKAAMVDVLKDAFGIDFNQMKRERMSAENQQDAKNRLLSLINQ